MKFKDKLKELRLKAGLTQQELAKKAGMTLHSIRNHEQGIRLPSWPAVVRLAKALAVTTDEFAACETQLPKEELTKHKWKTKNEE
jgi:DNA-binding XRE family transcriptional regulator